MRGEWEAYLEPPSGELESGLYRSVVLRNPFPGARLLYRAQTDSTMEDIRSLAGTGAPSGSVVATSYQHAGRGRGGRKGWRAPEGSSLLFSFLLSGADRAEPHSSLPLRLALAVSFLLEREHHLDAAIKWPNDVLVEGKKICGILCETKSSEDFIGIGLNCNQTEFPADLVRHATSILVETGSEVEIPALLPPLLDEIRSALAAGNWRLAVDARLYNRDGPVVVRGPLFADARSREPDVRSRGADASSRRVDASNSGADARGGSLAGRIRGIGSGGELLVETAAGALVALVGGEIGLS